MPRNHVFYLQNLKSGHISDFFQKILNSRLNLMFTSPLSNRKLQRDIPAE